MKTCQKTFILVSVCTPLEHNVRTLFTQHDPDWMTNEAPVFKVILQTLYLCSQGRIDGTVRVIGYFSFSVRCTSFVVIKCVERLGER